MQTKWECEGKWYSDCWGEGCADGWKLSVGVVVSEKLASEARPENNGECSTPEAGEL